MRKKNKLGKRILDNPGQNSWPIGNFFSKNVNNHTPLPPEQCWRCLLDLKICIMYRGNWKNKQHCSGGRGCTIVTGQTWVVTVFGKCQFWRQSANEYCPGLSAYGPRIQSRIHYCKVGVSLTKVFHVAYYLLLRYDVWFFRKTLNLIGQKTTDLKCTVLATYSANMVFHK